MKMAISVRNSTFAAILAGTLLLASHQAAMAGNGEMNFRDFREQNPELSRREAHQAFRAERNGGGEFRIQPFPYPIEKPGIRPSVPPPRFVLSNPTESTRGMRGQTSQLNATGDFLKISAGVNLDLTSGDKNIVLGKNLFKDQTSVEITAGGQTRTLGAGSQVSAAEYIAVKQILADGNQKITVNKSGIATGGEVDLSAITANNDVMRASDLVISKNVTTYGDFSKQSDFKLLGDLSNFGTVLASGGAGKNAGAIRADDINNFKGATISSNTDLTLDAAGNLNNDGTIVSAAGLTLSAGGAVNNSGSVSAQTDLNIASATVNNGGSLSSNDGNVNLNGSDLAALNVNNAGGTISALNGAINIRSQAYTGEFNSNVTGGDLLSRYVNINAGAGLAEVRADELTGEVTGVGEGAHVMADTETLNIGSFCMTGDPTFYNSGGDINITADLSFGEQLVIAASGDIIAADNVDISTSSGAAGAFDITLLAGFAIEPLGIGADSPTLPPTTNPGAISISGKKSSTGGSVLFGGTTTINASSTSVTNPNGGNVTVMSNQGKESDGIIDLSFTTVTTGGFTGGTSGDINLVANSKLDDVAIAAGGSFSAVGATSAGSIQFIVGPIGTSDGPVTYEANGTRSSTSFLGNFKSPYKTGGVQIGDVDAANFLILAGNNATFFGDTNAQEDVDIVIGNNVEVLGSITAGEVDITTKGNVLTIGTATIDTARLDINAAANLGVGPGLANALKGEIEEVELDSGVINAFILSTATDVFIDSATAKNIFSLEATTGEITSGGAITANEIGLSGTFGTLGDLNAKSALALTAATGDLSSEMFGGEVNTKLLILASNTGSIQNPGNTAFVVPETVTTVNSAFAATNINLSFASTKAVTLQNTTASGTVTVNSNSSLELGAVESVGDINITAQDGTLTLTDDIDSNGNDINISTATTATKSKMKINPDIVIDGGEFVTLSIGPVSADVFTPDPEIFDIFENTGGTVNFTGAGAKGKAIITLDADGADININNGTGKNGNLTIGSGVEIFAFD